MPLVILLPLLLLLSGCKRDDATAQVDGEFVCDSRRQAYFIERHGDYSRWYLVKRAPAADKLCFPRVLDAEASE